MSIVVKLTDRAHYDLQEIEISPTMGQKNGQSLSRGYSNALSLLREKPDLLRHDSNISTPCKFYRIREHFLICTELEGVLVILTIKHGQRDLPSRILKLEPALLQEADLLHQRLEAAEKKRNRSHPKK